MNGERVKTDAVGSEPLKKRRQEALIYFVCAERSEAQRHTDELTAFAERNGYRVRDVYYDRSDGPPHVLLNLMRIGRSGAMRILIVRNQSMLRVPPASEAAIRHALKVSGYRVVYAEKPSVDLNAQMSTLIMEYYLSAAKNYNGYGPDWTERFFLSEPPKMQQLPGRLPIGYAQADGRIVTHPANADAVRMIFEMYADGVTPARIAVDVSERYPNAQCPTRNQIYTIVENRRYIAAENTAELEYPPLISNRLFLRAAAVHARRITREKNGHFFLLKKVSDEKRGRLAPSHERRGLRRAVYACRDSDMLFAVDAAQLEKIVLDCTVSKLVPRLPALCDECIEFMRTRKSELALELKELNAELSAQLQSGRGKLESLAYASSSERLSAIDAHHASRRLYELAIAFAEYSDELYSQNEEDVRAFFEHLARIGELSDLEKKFFLDIAVREVTVGNERTIVSLYCDGVLRVAERKIESFLIEKK